MKIEDHLNAQNSVLPQEYLAEDFRILKFGAEDLTGLRSPSESHV